MRLGHGRPKAQSCFHHTRLLSRIDPVLFPRSDYTSSFIFRSSQSACLQSIGDRFTCWKEHAIKPFTQLGARPSTGCRPTTCISSFIGDQHPWFCTLCTIFPSFPVSKAMASGSSFPPHLQEGRSSHMSRLTSTCWILLADLLSIHLMIFFTMHGKSQSSLHVKLRSAQFEDRVLILRSSLPLCQRQITASDAYYLHFWWK